MQTDLSAKAGLCQYTIYANSQNKNEGEKYFIWSSFSHWSYPYGILVFSFLSVRKLYIHGQYAFNQIFFNH